MEADLDLGRESKGKQGDQRMLAVSKAHVRRGKATNDPASEQQGDHSGYPFGDDGTDFSQDIANSRER